MARQPRTDFDGAVHHVMNRGAAHQDIFDDDFDRKMFLTLWAQAAAKFDIEIVAFCLMGNHFHFLVISRKGHLSQALKLVSQTYTQRFNARHGRDGPLFRGRFHSVLVDSDNYFERVGRYIERNPLTAGIVTLDQLENYRWSSFQFYAGRQRRPSWLSMKPMVERYGTASRYVRFVRSDLSDLELDKFYAHELSPGTVLGRRQFVQDSVAKHPSVAGLRAGLPSVSADVIDAIVSRLYGCTPEKIRLNHAGPSAIARRVAIELTAMLTNASQAELAERYSYPTPNAAGAAIRASRTSSRSDLKRLRASSLEALGLDEIGQPCPTTDGFGV